MHPIGGVDYEALLLRQQELEDSSLSQGGERFRKRVKQATDSGHAAETQSGLKLLSHGLEPLEKTINDFLINKRSRHCAQKWVKDVGAGVAAYLTLKVCLNTVVEPLPVRTVARDISDLILDELRYRRFKTEAPMAYRYHLAKFKTSSYAIMARILDANIERIAVDVSDLEMSQTERLLVGTKLIDALIASTGMFKVESMQVGKGRAGVRQETNLVATEETLKWLEDRNAACEFLWPISLPMVLPPLPWAQGQRGGYRFALRGKYPMVRSIRKDTAKAIQEETMPAVYSALNRIQETAWKINTRVLDLVEEAMARGGGICGVPAIHDAEFPPRPTDYFEDDYPEDQKTKFKKLMHAVHETNRARKFKRMELTRITATASRMRDEAAIWFPCNLDFRGRVYPVVNYLHPQGDDFVKSLLTFAEGKPLGPNGAGWLALHGANCLKETPDGLKLNQAALQERIDWIVAHSTDILEAAQDPIGCTWWHKADKPLQFWAFCLEWAGFLAFEQEGRGEQYVCSLPCAMDGSCNGLQHFSAMLRDEIGGAAVNVLPGDKPQDIYQRVADEVVKKLEATQPDDENHYLAQMWLKTKPFMVNRKLTKRPVMTFGYGSKVFGFRAQIMEYLKSHELAPHWKEHFLEKGTRKEDGKDRHLIPAASGYMADLIWATLEEVVVAAYNGMAWLQQCARVVASTGRCVSWRVPGTGFLVTQEYREVIEQRIVNTILAGKAYKPVVVTELPEPNVTKQANAISPNVVHSLDAAALMLTVNAASQEGITEFAMVHDSFATVPADCPLLAGVTRQSFFKLYSENDVVQSLYSQFGLQTDGKPLPTPPAKGNLDISQVIASDYFFA